MGKTLELNGKIRPAPTGPSCLDCKHCEKSPDNLERGVCRLEPPQVCMTLGPQGPIFAHCWREVTLTRDHCSHFALQGIQLATGLPPAT